MMELDWSVNFHNTGLWVGYYTSDMVAVIDLGSLQRISSVEVSALTDLCTQRRAAHAQNLKRLWLQPLK